jgi:hypothetical protein
MLIASLISLMQQLSQLLKEVTSLAYSPSSAETLAFFDQSTVVTLSYCHDCYDYRRSPIFELFSLKGDRSLTNQSIPYNRVDIRASLAEKKL